MLLVSATLLGFTLAWGDWGNRHGTVIVEPWRDAEVRLTQTTGQNAGRFYGMKWSQSGGPSIKTCRVGFGLTGNQAKWKDAPAPMCEKIRNFMLGHQAELNTATSALKGLSALGATQGTLEFPGNRLDVSMKDGASGCDFRYDPKCKAPRAPAGAQLAVLLRSTVNQELQK